jgi:hypothetical protein
LQQAWLQLGSVRGALRRANRGRAVALLMPPGPLRQLAHSLMRLNVPHRDLGLLKLARPPTSPENIFARNNSVDGFRTPSLGHLRTKATSLSQRVRPMSAPARTARDEGGHRQHAAAGQGQVIEGTAEPVALPAPEAQSPEATPEPKRKHKSNRLMREADTAVGPRERKPSRR